MKWTKNERFPNDKVGIMKDEISDRVKGVGARFEDFVSKESEATKSRICDKVQMTMSTVVRI